MHHGGLGGSKVDVNKMFLFYEIPIKILIILDICSQNFHLKFEIP
jgi:hypothetical protein